MNSCSRLQDRMSDFKWVMTASMEVFKWKVSNPSSFRLKFRVSGLRLHCMGVGGPLFLGAVPWRSGEPMAKGFYLGDACSTARSRVEPGSHTDCAARGDAGRPDRTVPRGLGIVPKTSSDEPRPGTTHPLVRVRSRMRRRIGLEGPSPACGEDGFTLIEYVVSACRHSPDRDRRHRGRAPLGLRAPEQRPESHRRFERPTGQRIDIQQGRAERGDDRDDHHACVRGGGADASLGAGVGARQQRQLYQTVVSYVFSPRPTRDCAGPTNERTHPSGLHRTAVSPVDDTNELAPDLPRCRYSSGAAIYLQETETPLRMSHIQRLLDPISGYNGWAPQVAIASVVAGEINLSQHYVRGDTRHRFRYSDLMVREMETSLHSRLDFYSRPEQSRLPIGRNLQRNH